MPEALSGLVMKRKKVLYIISDIDKALAFEWIADKLDQSRFELSFILLLQQPAYLAGFLKERGIPCHCIYFKGKKDFPRMAFRLLRLLWSLKPHIVHCHLFAGAVLGLFAARLAGVRKRIYTRHHSDYHHRYLPGGIKWDQWCNRLATAIVAPSQAVEHVLLKMEGVPPEKIVIINHGFDLDYFRHPDPETVSELREKYGTAGHFPVVGVISRFTELKGIQYIIPAFRQLLPEFPQARILFFNAAGNYSAEIHELLKSLPADSYRLIPFENALNAAYRLMDFFVQVSTDFTIEAFGQTYVEALAAGVPSIFTRSGIAQDFIEDRRNALEVPFRDSGAIHAAMRELLTDKQLAQNLRQEGWNSVKERFALHRMIRQLEQLYEG
jgi:glycosyltransferase involved in cell wall biosynthesis